MVKKLLLTALLSMLPVSELRGSIPFAIGVGIHPVTAFLVAIVFNMIPVPFIILFIRRIFLWLRPKNAFFEKTIGWLEEKAHKRAKLVYQYEILGLLLIVAIPIPGTGAWTGSLLAALMDIRLKTALPAILGGVVIAGVIMCLISTGVVMLF